MAAPKPEPAQHWFMIDLVEQIFDGPITLEELKRRLIDKSAFWSDIAMCPAKDFSWVRLYEIRELTELCPPLPSPDVLKHFRNIGFKQTEYVRMALAEKEIPKSEPAGPPERTSTNAEIVPPEEDDSLVLELEDNPRLKLKKKGPTQPITSSILPKRPATASITVPKSPTPPPASSTSIPKPAPKAPAPPPPAPPRTPAYSPAPRVATSPAEWHLLIDDNEGGPFTLKEIETAFRAGKKPERAYVWRLGMKRWKPVGLVPEFKHLTPNAYGSDFADDPDQEKDELENNFNMRRAFRKSFVAAVLRISDKGIRQLIGVCGDITVDGLRLQQDTFRVQYPVGTRHTLEVRPIKHTNVPPFKVTAEVRWMDPDTHAIGFQFMDLGETSRKLLQRYLSSVT